MRTQTRRAYIETASLAVNRQAHCGKKQRTCLILSVVILVGCSVLSAQQRTIIRPEDTGGALANPGMGWGFHYYSNVPTNYGSRLQPSDTLNDFPGLTHIYLRIPWAYLEPEEGKFDWSALDIPAQRWVEKGKQIAIRISCCESWMRYATPQWVEKAGCKGHDFTPGKGAIDDGTYWEPDYDDPVFLDKLDHFLAALAARYDGSPEVAFIDIGSFGVWGEGHTYHSTKLPYSSETIIRHIDLHLKHFKKTLLAANDDFVSHGRGEASIEYASKRGLTLRDDSILVQPKPNAYFHADLAQMFWPKVPVVLECEHYGSSKRRGAWEDGRLYLQAVEDYHASYASIHWWPREFLEANRDLIGRINLRLGYRLQLVEASWPSQVQMDSTVRFCLKWRNAGVAPCLPGGCPAVTLKDDKGGIVGVFVDSKFNVRTLPVRTPETAEVVKQEMAFSASRLLHSNYRPGIREPGVYEVYVSIGTQTGTPRIALPLPESDGNRRYRLGKLEVVKSKNR
ncbi:MAG: DUF4832 domain-containing protein [Phycisphaerales bacterium]|nr:MAG: DUF4832 domain-containing protein [Phycisphaerales bacterium]